MFGRVCAFVVAAASLAPSAGLAQVQINQTFNLQGPSPSIGPSSVVQSGDIPGSTPQGSVAGAVQAVVTDPNDVNTIYAGTPGGGIWATHDGGATWKALTDNQASLSIYSLSLDPTDPSGKTLIAGTGVSSNGTVGALSSPSQQFLNSGGLQNGLLYTQNGGQTWTTLGGATLADQNVSAVIARGQTILAATSVMAEFQYGSLTRSGGLYMSTNQGATFTQISGAASSGLPAGPVTSLVGDPSNPSKLYAAVSSPSAAANANTAIYMSLNNGATWTKVFDASNSKNFNNTTTITGADQTVIKLATGPNGTVVAGVVNLNTNRVTGLFWSNSPSTASGSWTAVNTPAGTDLNLIRQAPWNFTLAVDPNNPSLVYVAGDETNTDQTTYSVAAYRINVSSQTITSLTLGNTANGTFAHSDSRAIAFDAMGRMILASDGSIYLQTSPQTTTGDWQRINGNLSAVESYAVAYDGLNKRLAVAAQDNGVALQSAPASAQWNAQIGADGLKVLINDHVTDPMLGRLSVMYYNTDGLGFINRVVFDAHGNQVSPNSASFGSGAPVDCGCVPGNTNFYSQMVLNKIDPTMIAIAPNDTVYVMQDSLTGAQGPTASTVTLTPSFSSSTGASALVTALAYGTRDNGNVLLAGVAPNGQGGGGVGQLWISPNASTTALAQLPAYAALSAFSPTSLVFDPRSQNRFYVADSNQLFGTTTQGTIFTPLTSNLPTNFIRPTSLEFIANNGVNALLVGGLNNGANAQSPIAVADSDASGNLSAWRAFGQGLPNTQISALSYNPSVDVLAVGTYGRGVAALYDVTSYFSQATVLQFGLADNDSQPDAGFLTDGTVGTRPLIKYGAGKLLINGNATYSGATTINGGTLQLGDGLNSGSLLGHGDVITTAGTHIELQPGLAASGQIVGNISGPGDVTNDGPGTFFLRGASTYTGPTNINSGLLSVSGSIVSPVFVNSGGMLGGTGSVGSTTVNDGGTLAPGDASNPTGTLAVTGNLAFQSGAFYLVTVGPSAASRTNATGAVTLNGAVLGLLAPGSYSKNTVYDILDPPTISGTFTGFTATNAPGFGGTLTYAPNDVLLSLTAQLGAGGGLSSNQQSVANGINSAFNGGSMLPANFFSIFGLTGGALGNALTQLSGEPATDASKGANQLMTAFLDLMLDPTAGGGSATGGGVTGFAPEQDASLPPDIALAYAKALRTQSSANKAPKTFDERWTAWGSGFGAASFSNGNAALGTNNVTASDYGFAAGMEYQAAPATVYGFGLAGGGTNWTLAQGLGSGRSDAFQAGVYAKSHLGPAYVSAALAFANHWFTTDRTAMADQLRASFTGQSYAARLEGGYRYAVPLTGAIVGVTPYAALQVQDFHTPSYSETDLTGGGFGLSYAAMNATDTRSELGARFDNLQVVDGMPLVLRGRLAWAHDWFTNATALNAVFQTLPGSNFTVNGAAPPKNSALTTAAAELHISANWTAIAKFDGEFGSGSQTYGGTGTLRYSW
jgi:autotransporter-associated beta strand protein